GDDEAVRVTISARGGLSARGGWVEVRASAGGQTQERKLELFVVPMPEGCRRLSDEVVKDYSGHYYYKRIGYVLTDRTTLDFVLVPKRGRKDPEPGVQDPETFYITRDKVTDRQFSQYVRGEP